MTRTITTAIAGFAVALSAGAAWAQAEGEGRVDPIKELKKALEKMRSAEELLAQTGRERAERDAKAAEAALRKVKDDATAAGQAAKDAKDAASAAGQAAQAAEDALGAQRLLRGAEQAAVGVSHHIRKVINSAQFKRGKGSGSGMEMKTPPGQQPQGKEQDRQSLERGNQQQPKPQNQQQQNNQPNGNQATDVYDAKDGGKRPAGRETDPNAWADRMPDKMQEDALRQGFDSWPGRYEALIRQWQKTLARLGSKR